MSANAAAWEAAAVMSLSAVGVYQAATQPPGALCQQLLSPHTPTTPNHEEGAYTNAQAQAGAHKNMVLCSRLHW
jgi:hypothetical protein